MKKVLAIVTVVALLIGGAVYFGMNRSGGGPDVETRERIQLAESLLARGEARQAAEVFDELEADGRRLGKAGEFARLRALDQTGRSAEALEAANAFLEKHPGSERKTEVELVRLTSEVASSGVGNPVLRQSVEEFLEQHPNHSGAVRLHVALARQDLQLGDTSAAQYRLNKLMTEMDGRADDDIRELAKVLGEINMEKLLSPALGEGDTSYTVASGDTINGIARRHGVTEELLMQANNIDDPRRLRVGQRLKIPNVDFSLHVDVSTNTLTLKNHGQFFKMYPVRTGREAGSTPRGEFRILNKKRNPTWRPGDGRVYLPGDPSNELGTRWMSFQGDLYGIHGTQRPETVGHYSSNGCVGMTKEGVEELFELIRVGTPLVIEGEQDTTRHEVLPAPDLPPPQQMASN